MKVTHKDGQVALEQVSFDVAPGEVLAIVGPSGSGKTTLLRAVAGLVDYTGTVELGGRDVTGVTTDRRDLAMVFEASTLISFLDVQENLGFGLRLHHVEKAAQNERVDAEARRLRLGRLLSRKPASLSAGESGRANIGRALVRPASAWSSTSHWPTWILASGSSCGTGSSRRSSARESPLSTSPTTRSRRSPSATG